MKRVWLPLLLALSTTGCIAVAAAAAAGAIGIVQYDRNKAHRDFEADFESVWRAVSESAPELGYPPVSVQERTPTEGELEAGEELRVRVEEHPEGFVCVAVRVGTFDTEDHRRRAGLFLNEVARRLGEDPHGVGEAEAH